MSRPTPSRLGYRARDPEAPILGSRQLPDLVRTLSKSGQCWAQEELRGRAYQVRHKEMARRKFERLVRVRLEGEDGCGILEHRRVTGHSGHNAASRANILRGG